MSKNLYIKTFGCQMNERDSEIMEQMLAQQGYLNVTTPEEADVIILNTCSIRDKAEQKVFSALGKIRDLKNKNIDLKIGVAGCVAQQASKEIFSRMPHVDFVIGTQQIYQLPDILDRLNKKESERENKTHLVDSFSIPPFQNLLKQSIKKNEEVKRFVTIMQGCNNYCSYCVVPYTRGREISRPVTDIIEEIEILAEQGIREITLLGQNVNSYGQTNQVAPSPVSFSDLLRKVSSVPGIERLRFTTSHPKDLSDDLMRCFADLENLCPHFHLPVQSGSNRILKAMNRNYTREIYLEKVKTLLKYNPKIVLATDIIVGFPGETDEDFEMTMELLESIRFHGSFSFKYSDRPQTRSEKFNDKIDESVKSIRLQRYQDRQGEISLERNKEYIGDSVDVMIEGYNKGKYKGRAATNHIVHFEEQPNIYSIGDLVPVKINFVGKHSLRGVLNE